ncbi:MAG: hypothetical protein IAE81_00380 [Caldilineaceae bacterium]|jgi:hypothetical protein|nr:hypothetical protein [Caldilineaceae bacterium]
MPVTKNDFTPEEWRTVVGLPVSVSMVISLASPAMGDMLKESLALAKQVAEVANDPNATGLLAELAVEYKDSATLKQAQPELEKSGVDAARVKLLEEVRASVAMLDEKAGDEAAPVKRWLYGVAVATAEAAKEGDFLGFGGVKVNEAETAALAELAAILQVAAA